MGTWLISSEHCSLSAHGEYLSDYTVHLARGLDWLKHFAFQRKNPNPIFKDPILLLSACKVGSGLERETRLSTHSDELFGEIDYNFVITIMIDVFFLFCNFQ